jgi:hypothetical protein
VIFSSRDRRASSSSRLRRIAQADPSATESLTCSVPFSPNSEAVCEIGASGHAPRIRGHCSSVDPVAYIKPEWTLVPGPFLCVMAILAGLRQRAPPRRSWHWGTPKAAWAGHQIVRGTVIKLSNTEVESADGWPAKRGKMHAEVPHRGGVSSQRGDHRGWADRGQGR